MNNKKWISIYLIIIVIGLGFVMGLSAYVDPYFHYHKPVASLKYELTNQRSQNDGILKHFDYNGIITGTSMTENFKTSEADKLFGAEFVKTPFSGGSYKEISQEVEKGIKSQEEVKYVIRSLDRFALLCADKDDMRNELGTHPTYLYDNNIFNDVKYVFNKDILFNIDLPLLMERSKGEKGGITSFDEYCNWSDSFEYGKEAVLGDRESFEKSKEISPLTDEELDMVKGNVKQNIIDLANKYPDVQFYYFLPPYSIVWWGDMYTQGTIEKQIQMEKAAIEEILNNSNIKLFGFDDNFDLITNLDNYKDKLHYGEWINSDMLYNMKNETGLLTLDNYEEYLNNVYEFYSNYDYESIFE